MKNFLLLFFIALSSVVYGQVPNQINYQAVARNTVGNVLPNKKITVRLSIRDANTTGTVLYKETRTITTNNFGLFNVAIGGPGADNSTGTINGIDWGNASKFIQVEIDPDGGSNFINMGAAQLLSVPYALYASNSGSSTLTGAAGGVLTGTYPNPSIANGVITLSMIANGVIPTSLPPNGNAGGDLNGTYPNPSINNGAITTTKIADGAITNVKVGDNAITTSKVVDGSITMAKLGPDVIFGSGGSPSGPAGGDLSGIYPNPSVNNGAITTTKLANNSITTSKIVDASVTSAKLAAGVIPTSLPPNGIAGGDLTGSYPNPTINNGAINTIKLSDNSITTSKIVNASVTSAKLAAGVIPTSLPPNGSAGGDLSGLYPNPTINNGAITTSKLADNSITTLKIVDGSVTSAKLAAGIIPTSLPPNGVAGGDLTGSYPNPFVSKIQNIAVSNIAPINGQVLKFNGVQWLPATDDVGSGGGSNPTGPAGGDLSGTYPNPNLASGSVTTSKIANGSIVTPKLADDAVNTNKLADNAVTTIKIADGSVTSAKLAAGVIPTSLPPNGIAGGDLNGSYPNPTLNKIQGVNVTATGATTGQVLKFDGTSWIPGTDNSGSGGGASGPAGGDLTGTYPNPTINNNAITTTKIADASITSAKLAAGVIPTSLPPNGTAGGDLTGTYPNPLVSKIQNIAVSNTAPVNGQVLKFNGTQWIPGTDNSSAFSLPYSSSASNAASLISLTNTGAGSGLEGINSSTNANAFGIIGRITSASPGASSTGIRGINNGTGNLGTGIWGTHSGLGAGVYGNSQSGNGIHGFSVNGNGVFGTSTNYAAGYFDISNAANASDALFSYTMGTGTGSTAISENGNGLWGITYSATAAGVLGYNTGGGEAIVGRNVSSTSGAVVGRNDGTFAGVQGIAGADNGTGVLAQANVDGTLNSNALIAEVVGTGNGNPAVFKANGSNVARIDKNGKGFFNGGTQNSGADIAEAFDVTGNLKEYEAGDVLVISTNKDRAVEKSRQPYSTLVAGVYATKPGVLLTEENIDSDLLNKVPMGVIGVIPTKVCLEGGAIKRGDLIVTSSIPGVAMRADPDKVKIGQVIGKALQDYNETGIGKINVLVSIK